MTGISGSCLCGSVKYEVNGEAKLILNCHCTNCQKLTGSVFGTNFFFSEDDFKVSGTLSTFENKSDRGTTMTRYFCPTCGSPVYGKNTGRPGMVTVRAGTADHKDEIKPTMNIYCDSAVQTTAIDGELTTFAKMPG